jgi:hypothetical protein
MSKGRRSDLIFGILLILAGGWFLAAQFSLVPGLDDLIDLEFQWPFIVIGVGVFLFLMGLLTRTPGMSVPACIVAGIGGILLWTSSTGNWGDWTYLWTLIPGFVGIGVILATLLGSDERKGVTEGLKLVLVSAILFFVFMMFFSGRADLVRYWPVLVILAGLWIIIQNVFRKNKK